MGRTGLARTALATAALSIPAVGMLAVPAVSATAAPMAAAQPSLIVPVPHPPPPPPPPAPTSTINQQLASYAKTLEGVPYVFGGTTRSGFDCSGLTQYVYRHFGKAIQRTAEGQFLQFRAISHAAARPGDLVFFHVSSNPSSYVFHVGIFEGGTNTVIASTGAGRVIWQSYTWAGNTVTFGTITH